jgi:hypothetical protein
MVRPDHLSDTATTVLAWLAVLEAGGGGYTRRGVRGWARREDIEAGTKLRLPEVLPGLRVRRLVDEDRVEVPGTRSVAVYRITTLGDLLLARRQGREPRPPWPTGEADEADGAVWLPPGASVAYRLLREAMSQPGHHPVLGTGWRSEDELWVQLEADLQMRSDAGIDDTGSWLPGDLPWQRSSAPRAELPSSGESHPVFGRLDLDWLERAGLALRTQITPPGRTRPVNLWRLNNAAPPIVELTWHEPRPRTR